MAAKTIMKIAYGKSITSSLKTGALNLTHHFFRSFSSSSSSSSMSKSTATAADVLDEDPMTAKPVTPTTFSFLQPRVLIFDGCCHLCHKGVKWVIKADKYEKIKFCCLQSKTAEPYLKVCGVEREDVLHRFLFVEGLNSYHQGSAAALRVASYLPFPSSVLSSPMVIHALIREAIRYDWFRKDEECLVLQEKELLERFIDRHELLDRKQSNP